MSRKAILHFRVNTPGLLKEITDYSLTLGKNGVLFQPINIFQNLLAQVAGRAAELSDPILDQLMFDLTLYELPLPGTKEYKKLMNAVYKKASDQRAIESKTKRNENTNQ